MIFGAKAAPAYTLAKDIIHLILCLQKLTLSDPEVSPYLKVIMVENYNVTEASHLIPACDISEQISLASSKWNRQYEIHAERSCDTGNYGWRQC